MDDRPMPAAFAIFQRTGVFGAGIIAGVRFAAGRCRLGKVLRQRAHISGDLPYLLRRELVAKCRHAVLTAVPNTDHDIEQVAAVLPAAVDQGGAGTPATVGMTTLAVEPRVEPLSLAQLIGACFVAIAVQAGCGWRCAAVSFRRQGGALELVGERWIEAKCPLFPLASHEYQDRCHPDHREPAFR